MEDWFCAICGAMKREGEQHEPSECQGVFLRRWERIQADAEKCRQGAALVGLTL